MSRKKLLDIFLTALISCAITMLQGYLSSIGKSPIPPGSVETAGAVAIAIRTASYMKYV